MYPACNPLHSLQVSVFLKYPPSPPSPSSVSPPPDPYGLLAPPFAPPPTPPQLIEVESAGDGWMWGTSSTSGQRGLFPESYVQVEVTHESKPVVQPPPIPINSKKKEKEVERKVEEMVIEEEEESVAPLPSASR